MSITTSSLSSSIVQPSISTTYTASTLNPSISNSVIFSPTTIITSNNSYRVTLPLILSNHNNETLVTIDQVGKVTWADEVNEDEAAQSFARVISVSTEIASGITDSIKFRIRDSIFNDIIDIADQKGSLTSEDLKYLLSSSKIIEKLKSIKE